MSRVNRLRLHAALGGAAPKPPASSPPESTRRGPQ